VRWPAPGAVCSGSLFACCVAGFDGLSAAFVGLRSVFFPSLSSQAVYSGSLVAGCVTGLGCLGALGSLSRVTPWVSSVVAAVCLCCAVLEQRSGLLLRLLIPLLSLVLKF
jgi:hypothetical protein